MRLMGGFASPYVRRVAISLELLGVEFEHEPVSVFADFERFRRVNPVVKAPSLVCDDGTVLMDSSLILQFVEPTLAGGASLWSGDPVRMQQEVRVVGLALAGCEKSIQVVYETNLRPESARYQPWLDRVRGQMSAAFAELEREAGRRPELFSTPGSQAVICAAVAWRFNQLMPADSVVAAEHPDLVALSERMEATPAFQKYAPDA